ncbi:MAG: flagellar basal body L-ring protein FlgH [Zetaproteobacteria bacterium]|nr:MAG: flagellar basal body L-ring protein FlgH [Zetaproteobacteria bacterium]
MMVSRVVVSLIALLLVSGCMPRAASVTKDPKRPIVEQALRTPMVSHTEKGSLWNNAGSRLFTDPKASRVGDLVTVLVQEKASATRSMGTKKDRATSHTSGVNAAFGLSTSLFSKRNPNFSPGTAFDVSNTKSFAGSGSTNNSDTLIASVTAVVVEVYPNGNLRIEGRRQVTINQQPQELTFSGVVRPQDIASDNTIASSKVAQAVISYGGGGELATVTHEGWLGQTLDAIWPF